MKINANELKIDEILKYLTNVINLQIKSVEGKNSDYKKNIVGMKFT
jgi:acid stress-induced BolA-like protein IbaG/YrbA